jgi:excisionase family DNA binding protein
MGRHPNHRLVKFHRCYTVEEAAAVLGKHKNTVRAWIREGLETIDGRRPVLIHGPALVRFLQHRRAAGKRPCPPGYMYCLKCRAPRRPAGGMADYLPISATLGNLRGLCPDCGTFMHRRVSHAKLRTAAVDLDVAFPLDASRLRERAAPSADCDSG